MQHAFPYLQMQSRLTLPAEYVACPRKSYTSNSSNAGAPVAKALQNDMEITASPRSLITSL
jgi:hypothetical protein